MVQVVSSLINSTSVVSFAYLTVNSSSLSNIEAFRLSIYNNMKTGLNTQSLGVPVNVVGVSERSEEEVTCWDMSERKLKVQLTMLGCRAILFS